MTAICREIVDWQVGRCPETGQEIKAETRAATVCGGRWEGYALGVAGRVFHAEGMLWASIFAAPGAMESRLMGGDDDRRRLSRRSKRLLGAGLPAAWRA